MRAIITIDTPEMDRDEIIQFIASIRAGIAANSVDGIAGARVEAYDSETGDNIEEDGQ